MQKFENNNNGKQKINTLKNNNKLWIFTVVWWRFCFEEIMIYCHRLRVCAHICYGKEPQKRNRKKILSKSPNFYAQTTDTHKHAELPYKTPCSLSLFLSFFRLSLNCSFVAHSSLLRAHRHWQFDGVWDARTHTQIADDPYYRWKLGNRSYSLLALSLSSSLILCQHLQPSLESRS